MRRYLSFGVSVALMLFVSPTWAEEESVTETTSVEAAQPVETEQPATAEQSAKTEQPAKAEQSVKPERPDDPDSPAVLREPRTPKYRPYWYLDTGLGYSDFSDPVLRVSNTTGPVVTSFDSSGDDFIFRIIGGYQFNSFFALETGLAAFGGVYREDFIISGTPTTTGSLVFRGIEAQVTVPAVLLASPVDSVALTSSISGLTFAAVGSIPTGKRVTVFGKAGFMLWSEYIRVRTGAFRIRSSDTESSTDLFAGIGFRYQVGRIISFGFDIEHFELGSNSADVISGMVRFSFGRKRARERRKRLDE